MANKYRLGRDCSAVWRSTIWGETYSASDMRKLSGLTAKRVDRVIAAYVASGDMRPTGQGEYYRVPFVPYTPEELERRVKEIREQRWASRTRFYRYTVR